MKTRSLPGRRRRRITIRDLANHLSLSPTTVSLVLNQSPLAKSIPEATQNRVFEAAEELGYRANHLARSFRSQKSQTIGVLVPELDEPYAAGVMSGIEDHLVRNGYFYFLASHRGREGRLATYLDLFETRQVEGLILLATRLREPLPLPTVVVSGHERLAGVTNVVLDHDHAAALALDHLMELGHRRIAFFRGQEGSSDTVDRWAGIVRAAGERHLEIDPERVFQLADDPTGSRTRTDQGYQDGYTYGRRLLENGADFTALFGFNDVSAIGAMRAFTEAGWKIPDDVSVVGFDDIASAAFHAPGLTTVRQPLREMGARAGEIVLDRLEGKQEYPDFVTTRPELVVRGSTGKAPAWKAPRKMTPRSKTPPRRAR